MRKNFLIFLLSLLLCALALIIMFFNQKTGFPKNYEIASWYWEPISLLDANKTEELVSFCKQKGTNTIYLSINEYLDILESNKPEDQKTIDKEKFLDNLDNFLTKTAGAKINVHALVGGVDLAEADYEYIPVRLTSFVTEYNKTHVHGFTGIQYDIEYYNSKSFKKELFAEKSIAYLNLLDELSTAHISMGVTIPYWFDTKYKDLLFDYKDQKADILTHIYKVISKHEPGYIVIMAYKNKADGAGGVIEVTKYELDLIEKLNLDGKVSLLIGQETDPNVSYDITYAGKGDKYFKRQLEIISKFYKNNKALKGFAVHSLSSYIRWFN